MTDMDSQTLVEDMGSGTEVRQMTNRIDQVTDTFVKQGVPVIVDEYGTIASDT